MGQPPGSVLGSQHRAWQSPGQITKANQQGKSPGPYSRPFAFKLSHCLSRLLTIHEIYSYSLSKTKLAFAEVREGTGSDSGIDVDDGASEDAGS